MDLPGQTSPGTDTDAQSTDWNVARPLVFGIDVVGALDEEDVFVALVFVEVCALLDECDVE